jgi:signal transduction histidine kinase/CheY-like chemotaxis protein
MTCPAPLPPDEAERLAALRRLEILDTAAEDAFERIVDLATALFNVPAALISLIDSDRQWFKANRGIGVPQTPRDVAFCAHTILRDDICLVSDATCDARFAANPLVTGAPGIRFYAGAPLKSEDGFSLGTLCLIDFVPRPDFGTAQAQALTRLAALAADEIALRARRRDFTALVAAEAQARAAAAEAIAVKTDFIETMSHEIRTPLSGIIGMADMLSTSGLRDDQARYAATLKTAAAHLLQIVNDVLDFSKLEAGALQPEPGPCNLTALVEEAVAVLAPQARAYELGLGAVFAPGVPREVVVDVTRLRQILLNLIGNGLKFTNYGGVYVAVRAEPESDGSAAITFEVRDTGIGIPEADLPRLFKRFSQLGAKGKRQTSGSGLGLAISHHLVRLLGGEITATSEQGKGSVFSFTLRLPVQPGAAAPAAPPLAGRRVLVAEANIVDRIVLRRQLEGLGASTAGVAEAEGVGAALADGRRASQPFDTLLLGEGLAGAYGAASGRHGPVRIVHCVADAAIPADAVAIIKPATEAALLHALAEAVPARAPEPVSAPAETRAALPLNILLAEDNEINQIVAQAMLGSLGHALTIVQNGVDAVAAAASGQHDLVLMDMMMPGIDGPTATRAIRKLRGPAAGLYIVALTANASAEHRRQCLEAGMNDFVTKPVTRKSLAETLQRYVQWAAAQPGRAQ